ncbi:RNA polymerase sigma factor SigJ [Cellulomonas fengjieae]|uniref:RNA polymerase sigma factor SigJ n=1 Tax=Cellulomonas fengjieae TaxID=2819978 RepID=A0ABS3SJI6_9CELL|nr:RNA polymerase sigma factor SigJ [Cellulomonas fengjieae]MBO3085817.1 RNA polymerase sigma factor SigJ [Cellulomonas fengjieae]QVI67480.1 RNA polymerase sigma factor SigJ [Cellulomonas fengjieae]
MASDTADNAAAPSTGSNQNVPDTDVRAFEDVRPRLFGLAYRMLGSVAEAEDVVQDAWVRWQGTDRRAVRNPAAFLTTTTTRLAINASTSAHARRETYLGPWLPEPVDTSADPALGAERAEALETAVLLLLEKLGPAERAAYVLREAFGYSFREIAEVLGLTEVNARQVARRAREHLASARSVPASPARRRRLVESFAAAARAGDLDGLERLLVDDVVVRPDGGGEVHASRLELVGVARTMTFLDNVLRKYWHHSTFRTVEVNGGAGLLVATADGVPQALVTLDGSQRGIEHVYIVVSPSKLRRFTATG